MRNEYMPMLLLTLLIGSSVGTNSALDLSYDRRERARTWRVSIIRRERVFTLANSVMGDDSLGSKLPKVCGVSNTFLHIS